ncbi:MAG: HEAT repeat domain-containing protein [Candidatus Obscuribacterales bacterium]|nr:HEAT repeat domain-containing protein [Candidatus Obscuribacterales bacterium]
MPQKPNQANRSGMYLWIALGLSVLIALVTAPLLFKDKVPAASGSAVPNTPMITQSINQLTSADSSSMRMNAARWLSTQFENNPGTVIRSLGESLANDPDPVVRAQAATSLGQVAKQARGKSNGEDHATRIIATLTTQYHQEASDTVRRCIIAAAAEVDSPEAGALLEEAIHDPDPAVKEEALRAKVERERRAQLKKMG